MNFDVVILGARNGKTNKALLAMEEILKEALKENEALKDQLKHSVKIPCNIGDTIYKIPSATNYRLNILNGHTENNRIYCQVVSSIRLYPSGYLLDTCDGQDCVVEALLNENWFLKLTDAEHALGSLY